MQDFAAANPSLVKGGLQTIGQTFQGRPIYLLKIYGGSGNAQNKVVFNGCQHAREWVSPATVTWLANALVSNYNTDPFVKQMVDSIEWNIIPIVNVDGFEHTWTNSQTRLWRKTRQPNYASSTTSTRSPCMGTDPNRNWAFQWGTGGSSSDPCSEIYMGRQPFSAPEPKALADFVTSLNSDGTVQVYIDYHAYGLMWMTPWGYTGSLPADYAQQMVMADAARDAIYEVNQQWFATGSVYNVIYQASGGSNDWTYGDAAVPCSYAVELRGNSFVIPATNIIPSGQENWAGLQAIAKVILSK